MGIDVQVTLIAYPPCTHVRRRYSITSLNQTPLGPKKSFKFVKSGFWIRELLYIQYREDDLKRHPCSLERVPDYRVFGLERFNFTVQLLHNIICTIYKSICFVNNITYLLSRIIVLHGTAWPLLLGMGIFVYSIIL